MILYFCSEKFYEELNNDISCVFESPTAFVSKRFRGKFSYM